MWCSSGRSGLQDRHKRRRWSRWAAPSRLGWVVREGVGEDEGAPLGTALTFPLKGPGAKGMAAFPSWAMGSERWRQGTRAEWEQKTKAGAVACDAAG